MSRTSSAESRTDLHQDSVALEDAEKHETSAGPSGCLKFTHKMSVKSDSEPNNNVSIEEEVRVWRFKLVTEVS